MSSTNIWNPESYDNKLAFVSEYGKNLIHLLAPKSNERILDLGCGTGDLTFQIAESGAKVTGIDYSANMIEAARKKYPDLNFKISNGESFTEEEPYDAVFSNAALHWMKNAQGVVRSIYHVLKPGGRFVAEFGGKGNVETIIQAIYEVFEEEYGIDASTLNPWYFPSIGEYAQLLEEQGFKVEFMRHYDRPTKLSDNKEGLSGWLANFGGDFLNGFSDDQRTALYAKVTERLVPMLMHEGSMYADYKRLTVVAVKI
ncbi:class I SAM-dependent methyltransferase [Paenibacillus zeisoli]|uniref:Class I SAM-dependent methyltransferase n=1 Tax=Paenibacillus zeisoli TaxID=2496267 RepID=A0A433X338_9BACL|nr:class I SAM-dependent methyltransferase [Paenibacillus zeisoli]RUT28484.1 class I SAM-dependent methyltransferase [Paenibacillus zeisoli]